MFLAFMAGLLLMGGRAAERGAHPCVCCMTSGAMKQGVPQKVLRARYFWAAHAFWNCPMLPPLAALLGLSAEHQSARQISAVYIDGGLPSAVYISAFWSVPLPECRSCAGGQPSQLSAFPSMCQCPEGERCQTCCITGGGLGVRDSAQG